MRIYLLIIAIAFSGVVYGYDIGITAGALLFMKQYYQISHAIASIFASAFFWGIATSIIFIGFFSDHIGRRKILRVAPCIVISSAIYMTLSHNIYGLIVARYFLGIASAMISVNIPLYLSETVSPVIRGRAIAGFQLFLCLGILFATITTLFYANNAHWQIIFAYEALPAIILLIAAMLMPESPRWLISKGFLKEAKMALVKLNHSQIEADNHYQKIIAHQQFYSKQNFTITILQSRRHFLAITLAIFISVLNQLSGINAFLQYDTTILIAAGVNQHELALTGALIIVSINVIATIISMFYIDKFERKNILRFAILGIISSLIFLTLIDWLMIPGAIKAAFILAGILIFIVSFALGPGALIWIITAEILPVKIRGKGISIAQCSSALASALLITLFLPMAHRFSYSGVFMLCTLCAILYFLITFFLPNSSRRTLEEIEKNI